jgi:hypothetical protein
VFGHWQDFGFRLPLPYVHGMKRNSGKDAPRWRVTQIGGSRGREVCELEAASADAAIKRAICGGRCGIDDQHRQSRLAARPVT